MGEAKANRHGGLDVFAPDLPGILDFSGRTVLVTGGTRGVGRGIALRFMEAGATVVVTARNQPDFPVSYSDKTANFFSCDVRDPDSVDEMIQAVASLGGGIDVLINNAGGSPNADAATASPRFSAAVVGSNLLGALNVAQGANAVMQGQDQGGSIVSIASLSGTRPSPGTAAYGAAKAGLINLTTTLAIEWAPKVRINCVVAGLIDTEQADIHYGQGASLDAVSATVPLGRLATPYDIADGCLFLSSSMARHVSGASLEIHGGGEAPPFLGVAAPEPKT